MGMFYNHILQLISEGKKLLAVLIDPDKVSPNNLSGFMQKLNQSMATHIFVGGSTVDDNSTDVLVSSIRKYTQLPIIVFPGDVIQVSGNADALLFLSLISGRNPDYLIEKQIEAVSKLRGTQLEVVPTGYVLIENGKETSVQRVTQTKPLKRDNIQYIVDTTKAGELLGMKLMYLEAGSGALHPVPPKIIKAVKQELTIPLIVGGGIRSKQQLNLAYNSGADLVVIGTAFEENEDFFDEIKKL
ncbi:geranylgeranylglyceryl/heptaprenylglyceryl phosphate synthase [Geojedonia litorea]|uniref:Geranylgeranylglyceryl phosphate synthase n=1 Tax=Geojedonia litorea TaxID=1268269 RepID=A0ABV9N4C7_9FLAO